jgi:S1-C subfamily serine protease
MKRLCAFVFSLLFLSAAFGQPARDVARDVTTLSSLMQGWSVKVYARQNAGKPNEGLGTGSGQLVRSTDGVVRILTNHHVVGSAETVYVHFDGQAYAQEVRVIGRDELVDLALLEAPSPLPRNAKPITIARVRDVLTIGSAVYAIGYPSGSRSISAGVVNSLSSPHEEMGIGLYFTHQAPISPGSSGGPLVRFAANGEPELVGINTQVGVGPGGFITNTGYSLKHEVIDRMLPKLETGLVAHARAGVVLVDTSRANPYKFGAYPPSQKGIVVVMVAPGTPALRAGLAPGDIIKKVERDAGGGKWENITADSAALLHDRFFFDVSPGTVIRLTIIRGKEESQRTFTLERYLPEHLGGKAK